MEVPRFLKMKVFLLMLAAALAGCATPYGNWKPYTPPLTPEEVTGPVDWKSRLIEKEPLSLEECVSLAFQNNRSLHMARRKIFIGMDLRRELFGQILPQIKAEGQLSTRNNDPGINSGGISFKTGVKESGITRLSMIVPIYSFGQAWSTLEARDWEIEGLRSDARTVREDLRFAVSQAYFQILEAQEIQSVVKKSLEVLEKQLAISQKYLSQGLVAKNDVLSVRVQMAQRKQDYIRAGNNVEIARATLNRMMGIPINTSLNLKRVLKTVPWKGSFSRCLQAALISRPDLKSLYQKIQALQAKYRATRAEYFPSIYGFGDYNYTMENRVLNQQWFSGGIAFQWSLLSGGNTYVKMGRKKKEIEMALDLYRERADDLTLEIKKACLNTQEASQRISLAQETISLADENLRIIRDRYQQGLVRSVDVLEEEERLVRAQSNYYQALYDYHKAYAALVNKIGVAPPE